MDQDFNFFKTTLPKTRKADYCLGCLDSSVFIDLDRAKDNYISLVRISFDGYGCCELDNSAENLNLIDSAEFIEEIQKDKLNQEVIAKLVREIIRINKNQICTDAIIEYKMIES